MSEIMKPETTSLVTQERKAAPKETFLASDLIIPRLLLMQGLSDFVQDRKAQIGDIIRSTTMQKLGDDKAPVNIIPLTYQLLWRNDKVEGSSLKFISYEPRTPQNENAPWDYQEGNEQRRRTKIINLFAFLSSDLENSNAETPEGELPDLDKVLLPVMISFRSTSYRAGQVAVNHFMKVHGLNEKHPSLRPYSYEMTLGCKEEENDKGRFFVYDLSQSAKPANKTYKEECDKWYNILTQSLDTIRVDSDPEENQDSKPTVVDNGKF